MPFYHILKKNLGDDFEFVIPYGDEDDEDDFEDDFEDDEYTPLSRIDSDTIKRLWTVCSK